MTTNRSPEIHGTSVCILGFGREGRSILRFLQANHPEVAVTIADKNPLAVDDPTVKLQSGPDYLSNLCDFSTIIRSPGISLRLPALQEALTHSVWLTSATNIFFSLAPGRRYAITGTKGKSTTSAILAHLLRTQFSDVRLVGNIGTPSIEQLAGASENTHFVVECSSFQLDDFRYRPDLAILLNIVPEHLDYHGSFEDYRAAKLNLVRHQRPGDILIANPAWASTEIAGSISGATFHPLDSTQGAYLSGSTLMLTVEGVAQRLIEAAELPVKGTGNIQNALAAVLAAHLSGVSTESIVAALPTFTGLPHRLQTVALIRGIEFIDDSLSTIPEAAIHALDALGPRVKTLIAGGHDRGLCYHSLGTALLSSSVEHLILFPTTGEKIWQEYCNAGGSKIIPHHVESMAEAVTAAYAHTPENSICLLSPAASSFNLFRDYHDRGEQFAAQIRAQSC